MRTIRKESLKQNLIFNVIYQVVVVLAPLVVTPKFSRVMGPDYVGVRSFTFSIVYYFAIFGALGLDMYGQRRIAIVKDDEEARSKVFWSVYLVKMTCCFISLCAYIVAFVVLPADPFMRLIYLCWTVYLVKEMINPVWYLQGIERFKLVSLLNIFSQIVYAVCVYVFVNNKEDLWLYVLFFNAIPLAIALMFIPIVLKDVGRVRFDKKDFFVTIKESLVYFVPTLASALYSMIDKTMLGLFDQTKVTTGYYEQAEKLVKVAIAFVTASFTIVRTRMSYVVENKTKEIYLSYCETFISFSMFLCWPIMFGIMGLARDFVPLFFGAGYDSVIPLVYIFVWIIPCLTISGLLQAMYIFPKGLQSTMNRYYIVILMVNCLLNLSLIPYFQSYGAVFASVSAEALLVIFLLNKAKKEICIKHFWVKSIRYIISAILMLMVMLLISKVQVALIYKIMLEFIGGCGTYFIMTIILRDPFLISQIKKVWTQVAKIRGGNNE